MQLSRLHLHQFRSHEDAIFDFSPQVTAIIGPNGSGKTNILEAVHVLGMGKSFRDGDDDLITYNHEWYRIEGVIDGVNRELRYQPNNRANSKVGKQLIVDGAAKGRFTYRQQLPIVLFEPDDLLMIHGSPSSRRKYLDELLQKLEPRFRSIFQRYERVLIQRNNLLKSRPPLSRLRDDVFVWDLSLAELGAQITMGRKNLINTMNADISDVYSQVAGSSQVVSLSYSSDLARELEASALVAALAAHLPHDAQRGFTTVGPHRDEIDFNLNNKSAKHTASRGEIRSIVLSLKLLEVKLLEEPYGTQPLLLLDDVFSELDDIRQQHITDTRGMQIIITTTEAMQGSYTIELPLKTRH